LFLEGRLILSRLHFVYFQKNGPGWGIVQVNHSLGKTYSLQVTLCLVSEEWPRVRNGPNISRGKTHSLQVTLCLVSEEWPRVRNGPGSEIRNNPSSLIEKNVTDSPLLILRADILSYLIDMSERLAQMIQFLS
jgi:hypothetical protein